MARPPFFDLQDFAAQMFGMSPANGNAPAQPTQPAPGSVARVAEITHAIECGDHAWLGQFFSTLEADVAKIERYIQVATDRLNGEQEPGLNQRSIEDMRRDLRELQRCMR